MITKQQAALLRHTLGADSRTPGFRNYFATGKDSKDYADIMALIEMGLMTDGRESPLAQGMFYFRATGVGKALLGIKEEK